MDIAQHIAEKLSTPVHKVKAAIALLDDGATVPFIARYRKEATGGLDDTQLRLLHDQLGYCRALDARRETILSSIAEQGKLTDVLRQNIEAARDKTTLEDLYLPYKPKRRTKAQIAREAGLAPLAKQILDEQSSDPSAFAQGYISVDDGITDAQAALDGARAIIIEELGEDAALLAVLRDKLWREAVVVAEVVAGQEEIGSKFNDYFAYEEAIHKIPAHRALALLRGRNEGVLQVQLRAQAAQLSSRAVSDYEVLMAQHLALGADCQWLHDTVRLAWRGKLLVSLTTQAFARLKQQADQDAIAVFASNVKDVLLASPAGRLPTMGLDPGLRTGVKVAVVDDTGKVVTTDTIYPHPPRKDWQGSLTTLLALIERYDVRLIAIGNGTASRETDQLVSELLQACRSRELARVDKLMVSEAGASVYSASALAANELPNMDVSLRGAVSIARRLQDPLAELVKIDPKSIGVGQYQHDVDQVALAHSLDGVVEDCVNAVGVDVNIASPALLARIAGLHSTLADNIVAYRDEHGAFASRKALLDVPRLGAKTYEQAAGFLRIHDGDEPLDGSAVHPEAYGVVRAMCDKLRLDARALIGNREALSRLDAQTFTNEQFGLPTINDILAELDKPGRDPRGEFQTANFAEGVQQITDLYEGMLLEGVVSNVANFGAFVDVGVHQDGLVHISQLADRYVADPRDIVKAGDVVKVRVLEVDVKRKRISLSMREEATKTKHTAQKPAKNSAEQRKSVPDCQKPQTAMAEAFAGLKKS
ncbi:RNA-binding transcriptional accessory protein [Suttonella sp. R2A3]|uniref:Tex family protein n=1 Tax=Suttonella sp. R2A3 TaxID=2908648 RepID=UPI001F24BB1E|nr:Tex family protein [Suttonella sp. R2A3]UJF25350.1 RNA-binding transcriptional accessory protein [Suttonella sp. R2A3]